MVGQVFGCAVDKTIGLTPEVLHREHQEEGIAIYKIVYDAFKLRLAGDHAVELVVGIEVIGIVDIRAVVVVAIGRHDRHGLDHRFQCLFKPALPLPFTVVGIAILYKVARENAELGFRHRFHRCQCATTGMLDILRIHDMAVRHIDKGELALVGILSAEMGDRAPVAFVSHTP